jgi:hypothetical protein
LAGGTGTVIVSVVEGLQGRNEGGFAPEALSININTITEVIILYTRSQDMLRYV